MKPICAGDTVDLYGGGLRVVVEDVRFIFDGEDPEGWEMINLEGWVGDDYLSNLIEIEEWLMLETIT
jgi:hypothetical protein